MRWLICAVFLGASLWAQTPPPSGEKPKTEDQDPKAGGQPAEPKLSPEQSEAMKRALEGLKRKMKEGQAVLPAKTLGIAPAPNQPCAIPLKNVLSRDSNPDPRMPGSQIPKTPPPDAKGSIKEAQVPAPSCDDVKK